MKTVAKYHLASDESKYAYKCLKCGGWLEPQDIGSAWDNLDLDRMEIQHCSKCGKTYEYYYSLDFIQYIPLEAGQQKRLFFKNDPDSRLIGNKW